MAKAAVDSKTSARAVVGDPLVGKTLDGRFKIIEKLGAGGMGTVYKAVQAPLDRLVALKVLNANYDSTRDPGFQKRFFLEASVTSKLRHPNTITVIDYGKTQDGIYYLAMEYVVGVTLAHVLVTQGVMPWTRVLGIAQQVARSLREAHKAGIIHRDLKPANVMLCTEETDTDQVKVLDFGLVKTFGEEHRDLEVHNTELTQQGVFLGSPQYMAPEQARNIADPRSDIYSLGVVMFQMLTGKPPFYAEQSIDVIVKHMREPPPSFLTVRPDLEIPAEVEALVMRCLEKEPIRRYQTMDELLDALRAVSAGGSGNGVISGPRTGNTPPPLNQVSGSGAFRQGLATSGPQRLPQSGAYRAGAGSGVRTGPGALRPGSGVNTGIEDRPPSGVISAARSAPHKPPSKKWIPLAIFGASALIGLAVVLMVLREPSAPAATPAAPGTEAAATAPADPAAAPSGPVRFRVVSEPLGATVSSDGKVLGTTPVAFEVPSQQDGTASANLTFELDGYETVVVTAGGPGPEVVVSHRLRKTATADSASAPESASTSSAARPKPSPPPTDKKQKVTTGYKDDPY